MKANLLWLLLLPLFLNAYFGWIVWDASWSDTAGNVYREENTLFRKDTVALSPDGQRHYARCDYMPFSSSTQTLGLVQSGEQRDYPTVFDYKSGVLRCGGKEVCLLRDIREIRLQRIMDWRFPGKAKVGLAAALRDGTILSLAPRFTVPFPFLSRLNNQKEDRFTDLGHLPEGPKMRDARRAASDIATRRGVSVKEFAERGDLAPRSLPNKP